MTPDVCNANMGLVHEGSPEAKFALQVRRARAAAEMTQAQLAARLATEYGLNLDQSAIARLESGDRVIRLNEAAALMEILGIEAAWLIEAKVPMTTEEIAAERSRLIVELERLETEAREVGAESVRVRGREAAVIRRLAYLRARLALLREAEREAGDESH